MFEITDCRGCGSAKLWSFLDLGNQALARFPLKPGDQVPHAPLQLVKCESCHLVQLHHSVPRDLLFREFWYQSGISQTIRKDLNLIAEDAKREVPLKHGDTVLDIGCNDGTLLSFFDEKLNRFGFEPAFNMATMAHKHGRIIEEYFSAKAFHRASFYKAKVVTAISMLYDLEDPAGFCREVADCLADDGVFVAQQNYLGLMLLNNGYDNVCHEHLTYFSLASLKHVLDQAGLEVYRVELNEINGGCFKTFIDRKGFRDVHYSVPLLEQAEKKQQLDNHKVYRDFAYRVRMKARGLNRFLETHGPTMIWGAGTRGATLFQFSTKFTKPNILAAVDKNPAKHGRTYLDTGMPIISREEALKAPPDYFLILPSHLANEIVEAEKEAFPRTRWIVPLPEFRILP